MKKRIGGCGSEKRLLTDTYHELRMDLSMSHTEEVFSENWEWLQGSNEMTKEVLSQ
jgi:hypothetical protein